MSDVVSVRDAKTHLSQLLGRVEAGEEILIARHGRPVARLSRWAPPAPLGPQSPRVPGWTGRGITVPDDFDGSTEQGGRDWYGT
ncbi:type II toxin-antitoxin system Phd/YefM family antitoxin [Modestobacter sp. URMC 112]